MLPIYVQVLLFSPSELVQQLPLSIMLPIISVMMSALFASMEILRPKPVFHASTTAMTAPTTISALPATLQQISDNSIVTDANRSLGTMMTDSIILWPFLVMVIATPAKLPAPHALDATLECSLAVLPVSVPQDTSFPGPLVWSTVPQLPIASTAPPSTQPGPTAPVAVLGTIQWN